MARDSGRGSEEPDSPGLRTVPSLVVLESNDPRLPTCEHSRFKPTVNPHRSQMFTLRMPKFSVRPYPNGCEPPQLAIRVVSALARTPGRLERLRRPSPGHARPSGSPRARGAQSSGGGRLAGATLCSSLAKRGIEGSQAGYNKRREF